tara:strand:- start:147 stop:764 length:618 start_codon:yes stop_codon:yes gene_type:complete
MKIFSLGPARSGTKYLDTLLREKYASDEIFVTSSGHSFWSMRSIPIEHPDSVVLLALRDPYESLASDLAGHLIDDLTKLSPEQKLSDYTLLLESALDSSCFVAPFEIFTVDHLEITKKLEVAYPQLAGKGRIISDEHIYKTQQKHDNKKFGAHSEIRAVRGHLPRGENPAKMEALGILKSATYVRRFAYIENMQKELMERYKNVQ